MNFTREKIMGIGIIVVVVLFFLREFQNQKLKDDLINDIARYKDSAQYYSIKINGMAVDIAFNKSLQVKNKEQLEALIKKNDTLAKIVSKFRTINSTTIIKEVISIKHDTIKIDNQIPCDFKPFKVRKDSTYYNFVGTISPKFFSIDSLAIPNKQSVIIGRRKLGFLKGTEERVEIVNSNPLIKTTNIDNYIISKPKKWYQKKAFIFAAGMLTGGYSCGLISKRNR